MEKQARRRRRVPAFGEWNYYYYSGEISTPAPAAAEWYAPASEADACSSDVWFKYSPPSRKPPPTTSRKKQARRQPGTMDKSCSGGGKRRVQAAATPARASDAGGARKAARVVRRSVDADLYQVPPPEFEPDDQPRRRQTESSSGLAPSINFATAVLCSAPKNHAEDAVGLVLLVILRVIQLVRRGPRREAARPTGFLQRHRQVSLQLRRKDPAPPPRRQAALRRRPHPRALRPALHPLPRPAPEAPGAVRLGRGGRAVPAADGGHGRAGLRDERRRPRRRAGRVRRRGGEAGPAAAAAAAAQDPGLPAPIGRGVGQDDFPRAVHAAPCQPSPAGTPPHASEACLAAARGALHRGVDSACDRLSGRSRALPLLAITSAGRGPRGGDVFLYCSFVLTSRF